MVCSSYRSLFFLNDLFGKHNSDKGPKRHNYGPVYERYFETLRNEEINLLEIGVLGGGSLRAWREYFPKAKIFGMDIAPASLAHKSEAENIDIIIGSQSDEQALMEAVKRADERFDIIIDDGSHIVSHIIKSFSVLFPYLSRGGIYVIEDLTTTYNISKEIMLDNWPNMELNQDLEANKREDYDKFICELVHTMDKELDKSFLDSIHMHPDLCILIRSLVE